MQICLIQLLRVIILLFLGLVEQINNFQTLSLKDYAALNLDSFLSIDDDYFYHNQNPRRPEVSLQTRTHRFRKSNCVLYIITLSNDC